MCRKFAGIAIALMLTACAAVGQSTFGSIVGVVHDKTQAVVPGASVQIRSLEDNSTRSTTSDQDGSFEFVNLKAGKYAVSVQAPGFADSQIPLAELTARQELTTAAREVAAIVARDFFPGEARNQLEGALADAEAAINACFSPDEPSAAQHSLTQRNTEDYRGRTWATRERLWIDRVASAWLIRRFIDPDARFLWLKRVKDCPKRAVGFDFDAAEFTHVGSKVTFEVLVASFDLERDSGLARLGALIHHLDVGGIPVAEGPGLTTIMTGARAVQKGDDALLAAMTPVFDALYAGYRSAKT